MADGEPEPRADAARLGGEERVEDLGQVARSGMPGPVSSTSITTRPSRAQRVDDDLVLAARCPGSMACAALSRMFTNTCPSRASSPRTVGHGSKFLTSRARWRISRHGHADRPVQRVLHVDRLDAVVALARQRLQVGHDALHAARALVGLDSASLSCARCVAASASRAASSHLPLRDAVERVLHVGDHVGERVVDLVRHAGGERAHRGQALLGGARALLLEVAADVAAQHEREVCRRRACATVARSSMLTSWPSRRMARPRTVRPSISSSSSAPQPSRGVPSGATCSQEGAVSVSSSGGICRRRAAASLHSITLPRREVDHQHALVDVVEGGADAVGAALRWRARARCPWPARPRRGCRPRRRAATRRTRTQRGSVAALRLSTSKVTTSPPSSTRRSCARRTRDGRLGHEARTASRPTMRSGAPWPE